MERPCSRPCKEPAVELAMEWKVVPRLGIGTLLLLLGMLATGGCNRCSSEQPTLQVFAASSLTEVFEDLASAFEAEHPGVDVATSFAGSQVLRLQIEQGAEADVFASANRHHLDALHEAKYVQSPQVFAHNELVVIVPRENPAALSGFADLPSARTLVIGSPEVPVGRYTRQVLDKAGAALGPSFSAEVSKQVVSEEPNVRLVRAKVALGEADAAIVYRTDAMGSDEVSMLPIPPELGVQVDYTQAIVQGTAQPELAEQWLTFVDAEAGRHILSRHGFALPEPRS